MISILKVEVDMDIDDLLFALFIIDNPTIYGNSYDLDYVLAPINEYN